MTSARQNPAQRLVVWAGEHALAKRFGVGEGITAPVAKLSRHEQKLADEAEAAAARDRAAEVPRFDVDRVDFSKLEELLCYEGRLLLEMKQDHYNQKEFGGVSDPAILAAWEAEVAELAALVPADEQELIQLRVSGPVAAGSRMSFRGGKATRKSADQELFGDGLKARILPG